MEIGQIPRLSDDVKELKRGLEQEIKVKFIMREVRRADYLIEAIEASEEYVGDVKEFYKEIYGVEINRSFQVYLIPQFRHLINEWPPMRPLCETNSRLDALINTFYSDYIITPFTQDSRKDIEIIQYESHRNEENQDMLYFPDYFQTIVFYISQKDFDQFTDDICHFIEFWDDIEYFSYSYLKEYSLVQFLENKFFKSGHIKPHNMKQVCKN